MRKIVAAEHVSLDGVMETPERWSFLYFDEELGQEIGAARATSPRRSKSSSGVRAGTSRSPAAALSSGRCLGTI